MGKFQIRRSSEPLGDPVQRAPAPGVQTPPPEATPPQGIRQLYARLAGRRGGAVVVPPLVGAPVPPVGAPVWLK